MELVASPPVPLCRKHPGLFLAMIFSILDLPSETEPLCGEFGLLLFASPTAGAGVGPWSSSLQPSQEATPSPGLTLFGCSLSCGGGKTQQQLCLDRFCRPELSVAGSVAFAGATLKRWSMD